MTTTNYYVIFDKYPDGLPRAEALVYIRTNGDDGCSECSVAWCNHRACAYACFNYGSYPDVEEIQASSGAGARRIFDKMVEMGLRGKDPTKPEPPKSSTYYIEL
jgi:hypothetical protein